MGRKMSVPIHIISVRGAYHFLSNFYTTPGNYKAITYSSAEHAWQAAKAEDVAQKVWIASSKSPGQAKKRGRQITIRDGWKEERLDIMWEILESKFDCPILAYKLLATGDAELVEGNTWGDTYWGQCPFGIGENHLGKLLMKLRTKLRAEKENRDV